MYKSACMFTSDRCQSQRLEIEASCLHVLCHTEPLERVCRGRCEETDRWFLSSCPSLGKKERHHCLKRHRWAKQRCFRWVLINILFTIFCMDVNQMKLRKYGEIQLRNEGQILLQLTEHALRRSIELRKVCFCSVGQRCSWFSFLYIFIYITFDCNFFICRFSKLVLVCIGT